MVITGAPSGNSVVMDDLSFPNSSSAAAVHHGRTLSRHRHAQRERAPRRTVYRSRNFPHYPDPLQSLRRARERHGLVAEHHGRSTNRPCLAYSDSLAHRPGAAMVSTLNSFGGSILANAAIVPAGNAGAISAFATNDTDVIVDINGYFAPPAASTLQFYPLSPCRVLDTRNADRLIAWRDPLSRVAAALSFPIPSSPCGAPSNSAAYSFNVTVVPDGELGYLTARPTGSAQPVVSTLNSLDGTVLANAAIVPAGTGGAVSFFASNPTDVIVDINGYFAAPSLSGLNFYTATPCRLVDTRNAMGSLGGPGIGASATRAFPLSTSPCGLPGYPSAQSYSLNMTVIPQGPLRLYHGLANAGGAQPVVSTSECEQGSGGGERGDCSRE